MLSDGDDEKEPAVMLMKEIAKSTFTVDFSAVMAIVWKRIKDRSTEHHPYKCLVLLEYLLREGKLKAVSQDHSLVAYLVQLGELTAEEARTHPSGNILVRSIGSMPEVEVDVYHVEVKQGDWIILCSDGLWGEISDADIQTILRDNGEPQVACKALVDRANEEGGRDNSTLIIARVGEPS